MWSRLVILAFLVALFPGCKKSQMDANGNSQRISAKRYVKFSFPEIPAQGRSQGRSAITLKVPREYVWFEGVITEREGTKYLPLRLQLPGPTPWLKNQSVGEKRSIAAGSEALSSERFTVTIGSGSGVGGRTRILNSLGRGSIKQDGSYGSMVYDGEIYGLTRYSPFRCYSSKDLEDSIARKFLENKPVDDPRPESNCRLNRGGAIYFSSLSTTDVNEIVFIECDSVIRICDVSFDFGATGMRGRYGVSFHMSQGLVAHWQYVVNPIRSFVQSLMA